MSDLTELLERVEKADGPDPALDEALTAFAEGAERVEDATFDHKHGYTRAGFWVSIGPVKPLTASIDAALALKDRMQPGCACAIGDMAFTDDPRGPWATIWTLHGEPKWNATAKTPPLAILAALLKALIAQQAKP